MYQARPRRGGYPCHPPLTPGITKLGKAPDDEGTRKAVAATGSAYVRCGPSFGSYLIIHHGRHELAPYEREDLDHHLKEQGIPRWYSGTCECVPAAEDRARLPVGEKVLCISTFDEKKEGPAGVASRLAAAVDAARVREAEVRLQIVVPDLPPGPRCLPDAPECGPVPYRLAKCIGDVYRRGAPRKALKWNGGLGGKVGAGASEDRIELQILVSTMDAIIGSGFPAVSLVDAQSPL